MPKKPDLAPLIPLDDLKAVVGALIRVPKADVQKVTAPPKRP